MIKQQVTPMPDQQVLNAARNAELDQLISTAMQLMGASSAYDLKSRDETAQPHCSGSTGSITRTSISGTASSV
jgi:hypothetical protein